MDTLQLPNATTTENQPDSTPVTPLTIKKDDILDQTSLSTSKTEKMSKKDTVEMVEEAEEIHNLSIRVTICAAFPIGNSFILTLTNSIYVPFLHKFMS